MPLLGAICATLLRTAITGNAQRLCEIVLRPHRSSKDRGHATALVLRWPRGSGALEGRVQLGPFKALWSVLRDASLRAAPQDEVSGVAGTQGPDLLPAARRCRPIEGDLTFGGRENANGNGRDLEAAELRLRPILMTSIAFILGVGPLYFATGAGAYGRHSVGTAIVGGMVLSTILNLFFIPVLYVVVRSIAPGARPVPTPNH